MFWSHGVLHRAESVQSETLVGATSVLLTDPTQDFTGGIYISVNISKKKTILHVKSFSPRIRMCVFGG